MALRAVFLDLDDTLVATSEHDVRAFSHAATVADERAGPLDRERLVADVRAGIKRAPWDPEYVVEVTEWRAALWASALENQGISAGTGGALALGAELQREYDANRMNDFPFMPEVPDAVAHLRKRGLRVVVITNGHHVVQRDKLAACAAHVLFPKPDSRQVTTTHFTRHHAVFVDRCIEVWSYRQLPRVNLAVRSTGSVRWVSMLQLKEFSGTLGARRRRPQT